MSLSYPVSFVVVVLAAGLVGCASEPVVSEPDTTAEDAATASDVRQFANVGGEIIELLEDGTTARIRHEEVPGYMDAMIMPLKVRESSELDGLSNGDFITFRLNVDEYAHWIDQVERVDPPTNAAAGSTAVTESANPFPTDPNWRRVREVEPLNVGDVMPNYIFTNQVGKVVALDDLKGAPYAFTFIYTRCPLPDFCPRMSMELLEAQELLSEMDDAPEGWRLFSITIDPAYDTPKVLQSYAQRYDYNPDRWSYLTGALIDITAIAEQFGLGFYWPDETISHNLRTVVIDRDGKVHSLFIGNTWEAEHLVTAMVDAGKVE